MKKLKEGERDSLSFVFLLSDRVVVEGLIIDIEVEDTAVCTVDKEKSNFKFKVVSSRICGTITSVV